MIVRPAIPADMPILARLMASDPLWQRYGVTEVAAAHRLRAGLELGATIAVAEVDPRGALSPRAAWDGSGTPAGFIWYVARGAFDRSGYVKLIGVNPESRGKGVGRALMDHAEAESSLGSSDLFLLVSDFNQAAQTFYRKLGYEQVGAIPGYVVPGITELIFRKRLRYEVP